MRRGRLIREVVTENAAAGVTALTAVVNALARDGYLRQAVTAAGNALKTAGAISDLRDRAMLVAKVAETLTGSIQRSLGAFGTIPWPAQVRKNRLRDRQGLLEVPEQARALAHAADHPLVRPSALVAVAKALADAGRYADAAQVAHSIDEPRPQVYALAAVVEALADVNDREQAGEVAQHAENIACSITNPDDRAWALAGLAWVLADVMGYQHAARVIDLAEVS